MDQEAHATAVFELQTQWHLLRACVGIVCAKADNAGAAIHDAEQRVQEENKRLGKGPGEELQLGCLLLGKVGDLTEWRTDVDGSTEYISAWELLVCAVDGTKNTSARNKAMMAVARALTPASRVAFAEELPAIEDLDGDDADSDSDSRPMTTASRRWQAVLKAVAQSPEVSPWHLFVGQLEPAVAVECGCRRSTRDSPKVTQCTVRVLWL